MVQHPAGHDPLLAPTSLGKIHGEVAIAFTENRTLGIRNNIVFEATTPRPTRSRAYASPAPLPRPSQGSLPARAGSPLAGRVSHPLDDESKFHGVIASSNPNRPAEPGRTSSSPGQSPTPGPLQIRTRRFPPSGSSADAARGYGPQIRTVIRGFGSGKSRSRSANRSQVRRLRWLRRQSHLYQDRRACSMTSSKLWKFPLTAK